MLATGKVLRSNNRLLVVLTAGTVITFGTLACSGELTSRLNENKALVRRAHEDVWSRGDLSAIDEIWASDFVGHPPLGPDMIGPDALREHVQMHRSRFPDWREEVTEILAEGDLVASSWISTGTDTGGFRGDSATGGTVRIRETGFYRIVNGRIVEQWVLADIFSMQQQLGLSPAGDGP
jgi:predicted ester cyclase